MDGGNVVAEHVLHSGWVFRSIPPASILGFIYFFGETFAALSANKQIENALNRKKHTQNKAKPLHLVEKNGALSYFDAKYIFSISKVDAVADLFLVVYLEYFYPSLLLKNDPRWLRSLKDSI